MKQFRNFSHTSHSKLDPDVQKIKSNIERTAKRNRIDVLYAMQHQIGSAFPTLIPLSRLVYRLGKMILKHLVLSMGIEYKFDGGDF